MTTIDLTTELLTDEMLQRFDERAPVYDRENRFFTEDWDELRASGYLAGPLPADLGGGGLTLGAANGEILAAGHGEAGNDFPVLMSSAAAERVDGGWEITAHKTFGSLSPVWT